MPPSGVQLLVWSLDSGALISSGLALVVIFEVSHVLLLLQMYSTLFVS